VAVEDCEEGVAVTQLHLVDGGVLHALAPTCVFRCLPCISAMQKLNPFPVPSFTVFSVTGSDKYTPIKHY
jgi:hypothetical protein